MHHQLPIWLVLLCCLPLPASGVRVHQPLELMAMPGASVLLNCTFSATQRASKLAVTWVRRGPSGSGETQIYPPASQDTQQRGRLALDSRRFRHHQDASLRLANLTQGDAGLYRCLIWTSANGSHTGNGTYLSILEEEPGAGAGVQRWAACGPVGVLAAMLLVLQALVCQECWGLRRRRRGLRSGARGRDAARTPRSQQSPKLPGRDAAPAAPLMAGWPPGPVDSGAPPLHPAEPALLEQPQQPAPGEESRRGVYAPARRL